MRSLIIAVPALVLAVVGCSSPSGDSTGGESTVTSVAGQETTTPAPATSVPDSQTTNTQPETTETTETTSDRPLAPDFTLELADGGTYTLSEGAKPVYLVFWAEW